MTYLAGETIMAVDKLTINDKPAAKPGTQGDHNKVLHLFGAPVDHLPHGCRVSVIGDNDGKRRVLCKDLSQRYYPLPRKISRVLYRTLVNIAHGCADAKSK